MKGNQDLYYVCDMKKKAEELKHLSTLYRKGIKREIISKGD